MTGALALLSGALVAGWPAPVLLGKTDLVSGLLVTALVARFVVLGVLVARRRTRTRREHLSALVDWAAVAVCQSGPGRPQPGRAG